MRYSSFKKAVQRLYPSSKLAIGPVIENGFYYDVDIDVPVREEDLGRIEETMREILNAAEPFNREEWSKRQALEHYSTCDDNPYKREIIADLAKDEPVSFYRTGDDWVDLCRGPHCDLPARTA